MKMPRALSKLLVIALGVAGATVIAEDSTDAQSACKAMENPYSRAECYTSVAVAEGKPAICDELDDALSGRKSCIIEVALSKKSPSVCDRLSGDHARTLCYRRVGDLTGDYSACDKLEIPRFRNACRPKGSMRAP